MLGKCWWLGFSTISAFWRDASVKLTRLSLHLKARFFLAGWRQHIGLGGHSGMNHNMNGAPANPPLPVNGFVSRVRSEYRLFGAAYVGDT